MNQKEKIDIVLPGELEDEDPELPRSFPKNEELEKHCEKSEKNWLN